MTALVLFLCCYGLGVREAISVATAHVNASYLLAIWENN